MPTFARHVMVGLLCEVEVNVRQSPDFVHNNSYVSRHVESCRNQTKLNSKFIPNRGIIPFGIRTLVHSMQNQILVLISRRILQFWLFLKLSLNLLLCM